MSLSIYIEEVKSKKDLKEFVLFPFALYGKNPCWIPPLIVDEINNFDILKNPVYEHAKSRLFVAKINNKIVGRVAALINFNEIDKLGIKKMRFGWFDMIDDIEVTKKLLQKVHEIGREYKLDFVEGPVGFSNTDKVGILTYGFDEMGDMITWYNAPYYADHMEKLGYIKANEWLEHYFQVDLKEDKVKKFARMSDIVSRKYQLKTVAFRKKEEVIPYIEKIFDLFDKSYSQLVSYVPFSKSQIEFFKEKYLPIIDPEFIKFVEDKEGNPVAFAITIRSLSKALKKANGKLFPFGFLHLLYAKKYSKEVLFYLIGVHPDYQKKGVVSIIFNEFAKSYIKHGIIKAYRTPELETNVDINILWKEFNPVNHKRRRTYKKKIEYES